MNGRPDDELGSGAADNPSVAAQRAPTLTVGRVEIASRVLLAPMSGVSDLPFRQTAQHCGADYVVSEMVASEELVRERPDVLRRTALAQSRPFVMQLDGREAHWMAEGGRIAEGLGADIIDINMGCPAREVTGKLSGSALMRPLSMTVRKKFLAVSDKAKRATPAKTANTWSAVTLGLSASWRNWGLAAMAASSSTQSAVLARSMPAPAVAALNRASA